MLRLDCCRLTSELDIKETELRLLQEQARGAESAQLAEAVAATEKSLAEAVEAAESGLPPRPPSSISSYPFGS